VRNTCARSAQLRSAARRYSQTATRSEWERNAHQVSSGPETGKQATRTERERESHMIMTTKHTMTRRQIQRLLDHWADAVLVEIRLGLAEQAGYDARIMARLALAYLKRSVKT